MLPLRTETIGWGEGLKNRRQGTYTVPGELTPAIEWLSSNKGSGDVKVRKDRGISKNE
jgi:hypothetical protein